MARPTSGGYCCLPPGKLNTAVPLLASLQDHGRMWLYCFSCRDPPGQAVSTVQGGWTPMIRGRVGRGLPNPDQQSGARPEAVINLCPFTTSADCCAGQAGLLCQRQEPGERD